MRLRVYPSASQASRASTWLFQAHRFRNEAVEFRNSRRRTRAAWMCQHPLLLAHEGLPEELQGSDENACSVWLTGRLEAARSLLRRHGGVTCHKNEFTQAVAQLSRGEREEVEDAWLLALPRTCLDQVIQDLKKTSSKAIADRKTLKASKPSKGKGSVKLAGFPTFQKWRFGNSVRLQVSADKHADFKDNWAAGQLYVPGLGRLRFRDALNLPATPPKLITVSRNAANQWHVSFLCVAGEGLSGRHQAKRSTALPLDANGLPETAGLDLSLTSTGIDHDGKALGRERYLKKFQKRLTRRSRQLAKKTKGSRRWQKAARSLGTLNVHIANVRQAALKGKARAFVRANAIVCLEDFLLAFMLQNQHLSASTHDAALGTFKRFVNEEAAKYGRLVLQCGRFDASSKTCSACGYVNQQLTLNDRTWTCPGCDVHHHRDQNAAVNIRRMALQKALLNFSSASEIDVRALSSHRLHPDLEAFIARGGLTALLDVHSSRGKLLGQNIVQGREEADETRVLPRQLTHDRREREWVS